MRKYPECFPTDFEKMILPKEAKHENKKVYRVMKSGTISREGFISTYEEIILGKIPRKKRMDLKNPGNYSTSCNLEYSDAEYALNMFMRHHPKAVIAVGETNETCGPCQLSSDREPRDDSHVDWWIYQEANPERYFEEVKQTNE